ncbi:hypothetical protein BDZ90DRAFT_230963 [Jaminaea rosea]|uniref:Uncharacterized protein n=1 Tax=Jaminaea rosea TaxID=1569628 RepID=A0A316UUQ1_9BASI|nr:hypothetical protein BDZ90DRAFT_230963 [Jaminaea rosea]PWN28962.1 hypothetical protein BDZ90DRAFT_230963 [Jaminaea rosea]
MLITEQPQEAQPPTTITCDDYQFEEEQVCSSGPCTESEWFDDLLEELEGGGSADAGVQSQTSDVLPDQDPCVELDVPEHEVYADPYSHDHCHSDNSLSSSEELPALVLDNDEDEETDCEDDGEVYQQFLDGNRNTMENLAAAERARLALDDDKKGHGYDACISTRPWSSSNESDKPSFHHDRVEHCILDGSSRRRILWHHLPQHLWQPLAPCADESSAYSAALGSNDIVRSWERTRRDGLPF